MKPSKLGKCNTFCTQMPFSRILFINARMSSLGCLDHELNKIKKKFLKITKRSRYSTVIHNPCYQLTESLCFCLLLSDNDQQV